MILDPFHLHSFPFSPHLNRGLTTRFQTTHLMITGQLSDLGFLIAERTGRILLYLEEFELHIQGIIDQKLTNQGFSDV